MTCLRTLQSAPPQPIRHVSREGPGWFSTGAFVFHPVFLATVKNGLTRVLEWGTFSLRLEARSS